VVSSPPPSAGLTVSASAALLASTSNSTPSSRMSVPQAIR
jgi:hypothetical protein